MKPVHLILFALLILSILSIEGCTVAVGSHSYMMRENHIGTAIVPMEDVTVKAWQLQSDGTVKVSKVLIRTHTVIRVGVQYIVRDDQISTTEEKKFKAMVPDSDGKLVLSDYTLDKNTAVKIGTETWKEPTDASTTK